MSSAGPVITQGFLLGKAWLGYRMPRLGETFMTSKRWCSTHVAEGRHRQSGVAT
jgi:hypothetical protein